MIFFQIILRARVLYDSQKVCYGSPFQRYVREIFEKKADLGAILHRSRTFFLFSQLFHQTLLARRRKAPQIGFFRKFHINRIEEEIRSKLLQHRTTFQHVNGQSMENSKIEGFLPFSHFFSLSLRCQELKTLSRVFAFRDFPEETR